MRYYVDTLRTKLLEEFQQLQQTKHALDQKLLSNYKKMKGTLERYARNLQAADAYYATITVTNHNEGAVQKLLALAEKLRTNLDKRSWQGGFDDVVMNPKAESQEVADRIHGGIVKEMAEL